MSRIVVAPLVILLILAGCASEPGAPASDAVATTPPSATPGATADPSAPPSTADPTEAAEPAEPTAPTWTGHAAEGLAFIGFVDPADPTTSHVFLVEADGSLRQVTGGSGQVAAGRPAWSRDGSQLAFTGPKAGETTFAGMIAVVNADGSDERQVAEGAFPAWSPDGSRIAFQEVDDVTGEDLSMYLVDPATGEITDLGLGYDPRWIDDERLTHGANTYAADGALQTHLRVLNLSTGESELVADGARGFPSPDGSMLLLEREGVVSLARADGSEIALAEGGDPVWSPDGTRVAVLVGHDTSANPVWSIVDLEGTVLRTDILGASPTWSPDGTRLALEVYRPSVPVIQVVDLASGEVVWEHDGQAPAWRPQP